MIDKYRLKPEELTSPCKIEELKFDTTGDVKPLKAIIGQERGTDALRFGLKMQKKGYNIYVSGLSGTGRSSFTYSLAEAFAKEQPVPKDWVYVYNFDRKESPKALCFATGNGKKFKQELENLIESFKKTIPETFSGIEYENRKNNIFKITNQKKSDVLKRLNEKSKEYGFVYTPSDQGLISIPLKDGKPINEQEYATLALDEREKMMESYEELRIATVEEFNDLRILDEEMDTNLSKLDETIALEIISYDIKKLMDKFGDSPATAIYLNELEKDIVTNIGKFKGKSVPKNFTLFDMQMPASDENFFLRYNVNLFIDNSQLEHAPIINESNPVYNNLMGSIEYRSSMGVLVTDFTQIKPGSLHHANGGYIIFQMREILNNPISWEMLKRSLKTNEINIENYNRLMGMTITTSLKPEPIPLDVKVIIIGDNYTYNTLYNYDDDFRKLFKIMADFDVEMDKNPDNVRRMAEFIANHSKESGIRHFDKMAVARVVEFSSRLAGHQKKLSTQFNQIIEILYEADLWADEEGSDLIYERHVIQAIDGKIKRSNKYEEKLNEMFLEGTLLIDIDGEKEGQINGLAVMGTGEYSFGKPSRITATVYRGEEGVISIEREARQSGRIHDKGVLILSGYLGQRYAQKKPLGLTIGIGFEQSYSMIDGDSASSTELYAILSSISGVPIKQYIAVTGSVNQKGEIQPIGGVNEKIEGYFQVCKIKGLTGKQGVMIPRTNMQNLTLREEVIEAVRNGEFHIYAIDTVEDGIEVMMDRTIEEIDELINEKLDAIEEKK
ncbi:MAG: ATP-binding protein [Gudongella sp.]|jgi:lon-related putative ATP-dependent protease|nr:ATP-binding protein [Gudongella sp.]